MEHKLLGTLVICDGQEWYVDNDDENFKDAAEETSLFLLPPEYADDALNGDLYRRGKPDAVGFWVYESEVTAV